MRQYRSKLRAIGAGIAGIALLSSGASMAQEFRLGATYVCGGEHEFVENCTIRDPSDSGTCMVGHPDHILPNGLMQYTYSTRGALKQLLATCTAPSAKQAAAADAFQKRQQQLYDANVQKANTELDTPPPGANPGVQQKPRTPAQRAINRCISSGRLPAACLGNSMLGAFGDMLSKVLPPGGVQQPIAGPQMAGVFVGAGNWRLDFTDSGVLVNCAGLSPDERHYALIFGRSGPTLTIDMTPKPLVLTFRGDSSIVGPGPVTIDGVIATGGGYNGYTDQYGRSLSQFEVQTSKGPVYDANHQPVEHPAPNTSFAHRQATCPALNLSAKGTGAGIQTIETNLLKSMVGGDKGPPTPPGIRMRGIFASAATGFSVQFYPESAVLGCGPDAARAYPYGVRADGPNATITVASPDAPLTLTIRPDGSLDPRATGPYLVHGRVVTGQNDKDDFTFAPAEQTCNLATLTPSNSIPEAGGVAAPISTAVAAPAAPGARPATMATPTAPTGTASLSIGSGFAATPGTADPLAGHPYVLLRDSYANAIAKIGLTVPSGMSPFVFLARACANRTPDCQKLVAAINADAASAVRADASGRGTFTGVAPGTYYLMISTRYNNRTLTWSQAVQLKPGANALVLDMRNATALN
jgi:hypothetical protein